MAKVAQAKLKTSSTHLLLDTYMTQRLKVQLLEQLVSLLEFLHPFHQPGREVHNIYQYLFLNIPRILATD